MDRQIPIYFDSVVITSPIERISDSEPNLGRLKVGVFTKYGNRNGSYITDAVAEQLISSATDGNTPVVGFFDPETKTWAGHTGPTLANAYGYVESFEGWEPFQDTDEETRDYAVFSVVLFTKYFDEASQIVGQHQSMELSIDSIDGGWADINGIEYYVYTKAQIQGLCIIGAHEPCFSVSTFFSKDDNNYKSQYDKFSSLLSDLKARVEEAENGGEKTMDENKFENQEVVENPETPAEEVQVEAAPVAEFEEEAAVVEQLATEEAIAEQPEAETTFAEVTEEDANASESNVTATIEVKVAGVDNIEALYNELNTRYEQLTADFAAVKAQIDSLTEQLAAAQTTEQSLRETISDYELKEQEHENARKEELIQKYEKEIKSSEEIDKLRGELNNFSYEDLEGKLAIVFANEKMHEDSEKKLFVPDQPINEFAALMAKYRR